MGGRTKEHLFYENDELETREGKPTSYLKDKIYYVLETIIVLDKLTLPPV